MNIWFIEIMFLPKCKYIHSFISFIKYIAI